MPSESSDRVNALARSPADVVEAALNAAKDGPLAAETAARLLAKRGGSADARPISQHSERAVAILGMLDAGIRAELVGLLPKINLAEVRRHFKSVEHTRP